MRNDPLHHLMQSSLVFQLPQYQSDAFEWQGHIPFAFWLTEILEPSSFIELGSYKGDSYFSFCQAVKSLPLQTRCFAVDTWAGDDHVGKYNNEVFDAVRTYHDTNYAEFSRLLRMTFIEALETIEDRSVDLLHIDGLHTYEAVKEDFTTWLPKLSDRAVVLFHDTAVRERGFGVWKFWKEISRDYPSFEFSHSNGLGVLLVGKRVPDILHELTKLSDNHKAGVTSLFLALGDRVQKIAQISFIQKQKDSLYLEKEEIQQRADLTKTVSAMAKEMKNLHASNESVSQLVNNSVGADSYLSETLAGLIEEMKNLHASNESVSQLVNNSVGADSYLSGTLAGLIEEMKNLHASNESVSQLVNNSVGADSYLSETLAGLIEEMKNLHASNESVSQLVYNSVGADSYLSGTLAGLIEEMKNLHASNESMKSQFTSIANEVGKTVQKELDRRSLIGRFNHMLGRSEKTQER